MEFNLTSDQFWSMTPRMFEALLRRKERCKQEIEFLAAQLASVFVNYSTAAPKTPVSPSEFMPSEMMKKIEARRRGPTKKEREAIDSQARALITALKKRQEEANR